MRFFHPPGDGKPSGGHVYNRHMIESARRWGFPLDPVPFPPSAPVLARRDRGDPTLWDSLFLPWLAEHPTVAEGHGILVHYLPHRNPLLEHPLRGDLERQFRRVARAMRFFLATGLGAAQELAETYPDKAIFLAEPGVDPCFLAARERPREAAGGRPLRIATVANFLPAKGLLDVLEALAKLWFLDWEWHLVGDENADLHYSEAFFRRAGALGIVGQIVRHGVLKSPEVARLFGGMDLYIQASHYESYGMALAEAVAAGLPAISTEVGEAERLLGGRAGRIVETGDTAGLRSALEAMLSDHGLRESCRERAIRMTPRTWKQAFSEFSSALRCLAPG